VVRWGLDSAALPHPSGEDWRLLLKLSWPVMAGMILQCLLSTVDIYFVSQLGTTAAAAVSLGNSVAGVIFFFSTLVSAGTIALVARSYGQGDHEAIREVCGMSFTLSMIIGLAVSGACILATTPIIRFMFNPDPEVLELTRQFLVILFGGTVLVFVNSSLRTSIQAVGDTMTPLYVFGLANILNALLNPLFIFHFGWGIRGSAMATVIATGMSFLAINGVLIRKIYGGKPSLFLVSLKLNLGMALRILRIGGWACLQQVTRPLTGMLMFRLVTEAGGRAGTAAFGIGGQLFNYVFILLVGLSTGLSILVGQSLGRGDRTACDTLIRKGMGLAWINVALFAIPFVLFPGLVMGFFISDPAVIAAGISYLRIVYFGLIFVVYITIYGGVFQGAGDTFPPMTASVIANAPVKLVLAYLLAKPLGMGIHGVWVAIALSVVVEAAIIAFHFRKGQWREQVI
jgi:putative MATE family efflux protein